MNSTIKIDANYAPAIVGFQFKRGFGMIPKFNGIICIDSDKIAIIETHEALKKIRAHGFFLLLEDFVDSKVKYNVTRRKA